MPIYEYHCDDCDNSFEALVSASCPEDAACPQCHSGHLSRQMSVFSSSAGPRSYNASTRDYMPDSTGGGGCCGGGCGCH